MRQVPRLLIGLGLATGTVGAALATEGTREQLSANRREAAAEGRFVERRAASDRHRDATVARLTDYALLQQRAYTEAVDRMVDFLRREGRKVREGDRMLVDGLVPASDAMPVVERSDPEAGAWIAGVLGAVTAGTGTAAVVGNAVGRWGAASTGTPISTLAGAAKDRAVRAFMGGGSKASGGGGMALGDRAHRAMTLGPAALVVGITVKRKGTAALGHAATYETAREVDCAELDLADAHLTAVDRRTSELTDVLTAVLERALTSLDDLEAVEFDGDLHLEQFRRTMIFVRAVQDIAVTPLVLGGDLTEVSEVVAVRYRHMTQEEHRG